MGERGKRKKKAYARSGRQVLLDFIGRTTRVNPESREERAVLNMSDHDVHDVLNGREPAGRKKWVEQKMQERWQSIERKVRDDEALTNAEKILVSRTLRIKEKEARVSYERFAKAYTDRVSRILREATLFP